MQNNHVEDFSGKLRDECLSVSWFRNELKSDGEVFSGGGSTSDPPEPQVGISPPGI